MKTVTTHLPSPTLRASDDETESRSQAASRRPRASRKSADGHRSSRAASLAAPVLAETAPALIDTIVVPLVKRTTDSDPSATGAETERSLFPILTRGDRADLDACAGNPRTSTERRIVSPRHAPAVARRPNPSHRITTVEAGQVQRTTAPDLAVCECGRELIPVAPRDVMTLDDLGEVDYVEIEDVFACPKHECGASFGGRAIWIDIVDDLRLDDDETARRLSHDQVIPADLHRAAAATATAGENVYAPRSVVPEEPYTAEVLGRPTRVRAFGGSSMTIDVRRSFYADVERCHACRSDARDCDCCSTCGAPPESCDPAACDAVDVRDHELVGSAS